MKITHAGSMLIPRPEAYKALPRPPFGKSDHLSIQDCFDDADWEMFQEASTNNIDKYAYPVTGFI